MSQVALEEQSATWPQMKAELSCALLSVQVLGTLYTACTLEEDC